MRLTKTLTALALATVLALPAMAQTAAPATTTPAKPAATAPATPAPATTAAPAAAAPATTTSVKPVTTAKPAKAEKKPFTDTVNINTADAATLDKLYGIGKSRAASIIKNRPYKAADELVSKKVLPQSVFDKIKGQLAI